MLTALTLVLGFVVSLLVAVHFLCTTLLRKRRPGEPPIVPGSLLLGNAAQFGRDAVKFLRRATDNFGNIFTIRLINQYLTIVMDPNAYESLSGEKNFDFDPIQKQVNWNVFSFVLREPKRIIRDTGRTVRGKHLDHAMNNFVNNLDLAYCQVKVNPDWETRGLRQFAADTIFNGIFNSVFGRGVEGHPFNARAVHQHFEVYHRYFNYLWLGVPRDVFRPAVRALEGLLTMPDSADLLARPDLCEYIRLAITYMTERGQTEGDMKGHNLVYLHVNYNTYRLAFWAINNLLENGAALDALKAEIAELVEERGREEEDGATHVTLSAADVEGLKILDSLVQETVRMSSGVFVVRYVQEDTWYKTGPSDKKKHLIRKGDRIAIYPPAIHKDPEIFEEPTVFKYDRFVDAKFYKGDEEVKHPVVGFGTLCPGKRFALLQLKWFLVTLVTRFDLRFRPGQTGAQYDFTCHGHEILPPVRDIDIDFRQRSDFPRFHFEHDLDEV